MSGSRAKRDENMLDPVKLGKLTDENVPSTRTTGVGTAGGGLTGAGGDRIGTVFPGGFASRDKYL